MALDEGGRIDDCERVAVFDDLDIVGRDDGDDREDGTIRLPALCAAAGVVVGDVALDADCDGIAWSL